MRSLLAIVLSTAGLVAQPLILLPIADATTHSGQPILNAGTSTRLEFGKNTSSTATSPGFLRGHVQFDLTPFLGSGLVPTRAVFFWYQDQSNAAGCLDVSLHRLTAPWTETTVTWQNQPSYDPVEETRTCVGDSFALGWKEFEITSLVRAWFAGTVPDFGIVIRDPMEITAGASRPGLGLSRENPNAALAPYLRIEFAESFGNGCTTHASTPTYDVASGKAIMGETLDLRVSGTLPGSFGIAFFGLSNTQWGGGSLPFPLTALGYANCDLNIDPGGSVTIGLMPTATTVLPIVIPTAAPFSGMSLYTQAFVLTPTSAIEVSNGLGFAVWL